MAAQHKAGHDVIENADVPRLTRPTRRRKTCPQQHADPPHPLGLLRARRKGPAGRRAASETWDSFGTSETLAFLPPLAVAYVPRLL